MANIKINQLRAASLFWPAVSAALAWKNPQNPPFTFSFLPACLGARVCLYVHERTQTCAPERFGTRGSTLRFPPCRGGEKQEGELSPQPRQPGPRRAGMIPRAGGRGARSAAPAVITPVWALKTVTSFPVRPPSAVCLMPSPFKTSPFAAVEPADTFTSWEVRPPGSSCPLRQATARRNGSTIVLQMEELSYSKALLSPHLKSNSGKQRGALLKHANANK